MDNGKRFMEYDSILEMNDRINNMLERYGFDFSSADKGRLISIEYIDVKLTIHEHLVRQSRTRRKQTWCHS